MKNFSLIQQVGFWFFLLFSMIMITQGELTLAGAVQRSLIMGAAYAINFYICFLVLTPLYFERKRYTEFILYMLLMHAVIAFLRFNIDTTFLHRLVDKPYKKLIVIIVTNLTVSSFSVMLRLSLSRLDYERKYIEKEKEQISTELQLLKSQIHPHFLFNTLNNLYTLILQRSDKAADALMRLSDLLRYLLYECEQSKVRLRKEMDALRSFIALHQLKYEKPVHVILTEQNVDDNVMIEPMLLIPLIENAFKYSDIGINEGAYIKLEVIVSERHINIEISNTTERQQPPANDIGGIGLRNVRRRLELSYGASFSLDISDLGNFFTVRLQIPRV
ncbi:MAG: histidine kinase [Bacteroidetes bacterium]|nr:histidine kinase [Bacteroidota bacterium]